MKRPLANNINIAEVHCINQLINEPNADKRKSILQQKAHTSHKSQLRKSVTAIENVLLFAGNRNHSD